MSESATGLAGVLKRGATMSAVGLIVAQCATVVQTIVLGRLLGPTEVGIFMAGSVLIGFLVTFSQGSLVQALVHRDGDIEQAANTALVATFVTGLLGTLAVLAAAPVIGMLFHSSEVALIAAATSGVMLLHVCASVPDSLMQRRFQFTRQMIITPAVSISFAAVSIVFATMGYGAWAMVIGWYASTVTAVVLSWWMARWRPFAARFSWPVWREMARYSFPLLLDSIAERLREVFEQLVVGRAMGTDVLGQYRYAYRLASLPSLAVVTVCSHVLFPAFSRISDDKHRFKDAYLRALGWIWLAAAPLAAVLVITGEALVVLLLGEEWRGAGVATAAMAGMGLGAALNSVNGEAIKGAGRSSLLMWSPALALGVGVPAILLLLPYGLFGVSIAISATCLVVGAVNLALAHRVVGTSRREISGCLVPPTIAALIATAAVLPLEQFVIESDRQAVAQGLAWVVAECVLLAGVYLAALRVVSPSRFRSVSTAVAGVVTRAAARSRRSS